MSISVVVKLWSSDVFDHFNLFVVSIIVSQVCVVVKLWSSDVFDHFNLFVVSISVLCACVRTYVRL